MGHPSAIVKLFIILNALPLEVSKKQKLYSTISAE